MCELKTIRGKKRKHNLFLHALAMPGLVLSSVFPQSGASHPRRGAPGAAWPGATTEPVLPHGCRGTTKHQCRWQGQPEGQSAPHIPQDPCPWRGVRWPETTWVLADCCLCHLQHPTPLCLSNGTAGLREESWSGKCLLPLDPSFLTHFVHPPGGYCRDVSFQPLSHKRGELCKHSILSPFNPSVLIKFCLQLEAPVLFKHITLMSETLVLKGWVLFCFFNLNETLLYNELIAVHCAVTRRRKLELQHIT